MRHRGVSGKKGFAIGALFGGLVGGITALLFAPKSGDKTRKEIVNKYHDVSEKAHCMLENVCDQTSELIEKAKDIASDAKDAASKLLKDKRRK